VLTSLDERATLYATYAAAIAPTSPTLQGLADTIVRRFPALPGNAVRIFSPDGTLLTSDRALGQFPSRAVQPWLDREVPLLTYAPANRTFVARPILQGSTVLGVVEVSSDAAGEQALLHALALALLPGALVALAGATILATILARTLLRPLRQLRHVAAEIAGGDLQARSNDHSDDEIGLLAQQINQMAAELQARFDEVERLSQSRHEFYRSISHELRTPLTAIRGLSENMEDDATGEQRAQLEMIAAETGRLQRLVEELLAGGAPGFVPLRNRAPVEIAGLIDAAVRLMQPRAERAVTQLGYHAAVGAGAILGDYDRLKQALINVLDNALKWTPPGGAIRVRLQLPPTHDDAVVVVSDTGPGIPPDLRATLWQRGTHSGESGTGLGLALVHEVVEAHGGPARLLDGPGTTIELRLPLIHR
jgi:signal transduction histidine kinase